MLFWLSRSADSPVKSDWSFLINRGKNNMNVYKLALAFVCGGTLVAGSVSSASAQSELLVKNAAGGDTGAYFNSTGEFTRLITIRPGCSFYINRRETRWEAHFSRNARLERRNRSVVCSW